MLITFEGPDGCGKSTQIALLAESLGQQGYRLYQTREPGGSDIGEKIRDILHGLKNTGMSQHAEILLYSASRAQLVAEKIRPLWIEAKLSCVIASLTAHLRIKVMGTD